MKADHPNTFKIGPLTVVMEVNETHHLDEEEEVFIRLVDIHQAQEGIIISK